MRNAIEADELVSRELSAVIESICGDPDIDEAVTLGFVRDRIRKSLDGFAEAERIHRFGDEEMLCTEVDTLIEEYGEDVLATDLATVRASEELSIVIEAVIDDTDEDIAPTLGTVKLAMSEGLVARLAGEGLVEPDEEQMLLAEIDALIVRWGADAMAESVLRFD
ncbi:MAG TPA: hypothetical protein VMV91_06075 [Rhodocyclaceae bacterium]|nr:hypothetical protein [Rhodocyclaceae bacterium]